MGYDCIIVESDVVWSKLAGKFNRAFFLACDSMKHMKRVAYGPDIGELELDSGSKNELKELLKQVQHISCRGNAPVPILQECTEKKVQPVLDPTLLIKRSDYDEICCERIVKERYLLYYYIENSKLMKEAVEKFAKQHNLKIIELTSRISKNNFFRIDEINYSYGIEQFVSLIKYAECVFTDSFHGLCVSIQYEKEFYAFPRKKEKKVIDLCQMLGVENRYMANETNTNLDMNPIDYKKVHRNIQEWKETSMQWLINSLGE